MLVEHLDHLLHALSLIFRYHENRVWRIDHDKIIDSDGNYYSITRTQIASAAIQRQGIANLNITVSILIAYVVQARPVTYITLVSIQRRDCRADGVLHDSVVY